LGSWGRREKKLAKLRNAKGICGGVDNLSQYTVVRVGFGASYIPAQEKRIQEGRGTVKSGEGFHSTNKRCEESYIGIRTEQKKTTTALSETRVQKKTDMRVHRLPTKTLPHEPEGEKNMYRTCFAANRNRKEKKKKFAKLRAPKSSPSKI